MSIFLYIIIFIVILNILINYDVFYKKVNINNKYLLPIYIPDQESNAQKYINHMFNIASEYNRILVLPPIEDGRITICGKHKFNEYYSQSSLERYKNTSYIYYEDFIKFNKLNNINELLIFSDKPNKIIYPNCTEKFYSLKKNIVENIIDLERYLYLKEKQNIILISYETHNKKYCYKNKDCDINFKYNSKYIDVFNEIRNTINSSYLALHWRMESTNYEHLTICSLKLLEYIQKIKNKKKIEKIIFLTDYPHIKIYNSTINNLIGESKTFKNITTLHEKSIENIKNNLDFILTTNDYNLKNNKKYLYVNTSYLDSSSLGIIDKLIAINSDIFLTSNLRYTGRNSSYINYIINERKTINKESYYWS